MKTDSVIKMKMHILVLSILLLSLFIFDVRLLYLFLDLLFSLSHRINWICFGNINFEGTLAYKWCMSYAEMISMMLTIKFPVTTNTQIYIVVCVSVFFDLFVDCNMNAIDVCLFVFSWFLDRINE